VQASQSPTLIQLPFASGGAYNAIPVASQVATNAGGASLVDGFPPATRTPLAAGGIPPSGLDMNGILNLITQSIRWAHGGGQYPFNSAFASSANVGGYPSGARLMRADTTGDWINASDGNQTNPDATDGSAANWVPGYNYGVTAITGLITGNITLTPSQASKSRIVLSGAPIGNMQVIFPAWTKEWEVVNNTNSAVTITARTASGTGVILAAGQQKITGDGTNITQPAESVAPATQNGHAVNLGQFSAILSQNGYIAIPVVAAGVKQNFIIAYLEGISASNGIVTQAWPVTFPNALLSANATYVANGAALAAITASISTNTTASTCIVNVSTSAGEAVASANVRVIAMGY
jgi:hypothetical protein